MRFVVHQDVKVNLNIQVRIHDSGLHYFDPRNEDFTLINTVSKNKEGFTARHIKGAEAARDLYATLVYPSAKD